MSRLIAIDPGLKGALVLFVDGKIKEWIPMPCTKASGHNYPDSAEIEAWLWKHQPEDIVIEHAYGMEGSSTQAVFHYGVGFGLTYGACLSQKVKEVVLLRPQEWQSKLFASILTGKQLQDDSKVKALACVRKLYPDANLFRNKRCSTPDEGMVDAVCIGFYYMWKIGALKEYAKM